jgi:hypothetical protein
MPVALQLTRVNYLEEAVFGGVIDKLKTVKKEKCINEV